MTVLSDIGNVCSHTGPGQMDTDGQTEGAREREKAAKGKFSTMDSYHQTSLQAAFVCFYLQEMNHLQSAKPVLDKHTSLKCMAFN